MMGTELGSESENEEVVQQQRRKSPRVLEQVPPSQEGCVSDDSSLTEPAPSPPAERPATPAATRSSQAHRRKIPAPKKTETKALKEIAKQQQQTDPIIPKLPFARLIREILMEYSHRELRITPESLLCLQESAEIFAVQLMEDAYRCTLHRDRMTLMPKDMRLALMLRKDSVLI